MTMNSNQFLYIFSYAFVLGTIFMVSIFSNTVVASEEDSCISITPQGNPQDNYDTIASCLASGLALLTGGIYNVTSGFSVPSNAILQGNSSAPTIIQLVGPSQTNYMVTTGDYSLVAYISFQANGFLPAGCCSAIFSVGGSSNALVHDCAGSGQDNPIATGIYYLGASGTNNTFLRVEISAMQYGVIFVQGLLPGSANRVQECYLHDNLCDSVTFAGYGELVGSTIENNGWDCKNGNPPIPGGGPYCLGNVVGALVAENTVSSNCGMLFDIDSCSNFNVTGNSFSQPGNTWGGAYPYCQGSLAVNLIDTSNFLFDSNVVQNTLDSNAVGLSAFGDCNHVFGDVGAAPFSDLPDGGNTVLAFTITTRPTAIATTSNTITNNQFHADCGSSNCAGLGYFASRGTGYAGSGGPWSPNMYTLNDPFGSDIGSHRCGGNWYAGNTPNCPENPPAPCNWDDYQHPDTSNWRNDADCSTYSSSRSRHGQMTLIDMVVTRPSSSNGIRRPST